MLLKELAASLNAKYEGNGDLEINRVANLKTAGPGEISFLSDRKYKDVLSNTQASCVIIRFEDICHAPCAYIVMDDPYLGFARASQILDTTPPVATGVSPLCQIDEGAVVGKNVAIGPFVHIAKGAVIGDDVQIAANCTIGEGAVIGDRTRLYPNVSIYHHVHIGRDCLIQSGTVIGSDGFGYANERGRWVKIPQTGTVKIGNMVEIGANTCIDRGAIDDTVIEDNVIIDNLCQIAHNVRIGYGTAVAGGTVFAGSVKIGRYCIIGGTSVFNGHIEICDEVTISGMCMVMRSIDKKGVYSSGIPAQTNKEWRVTASRVLHINDMYRKVQNMEKQISELEQKLSK